MDFYIVIPCHNEAQHIKKTLDSLVNQTLLPKRIVVVNDQSTDESEVVISAFAKAYSFISYINITSSEEHLPGSKVIRAFQRGLDTLDENYDIICKYDADLIFPEDYLSTIAEHFVENPNIGMAGGFCYIEKNNVWKLENLTNKDHIRGALKAYRKSCFKTIGGLKAVMGWDTIDELLAIYHGWQVKTNERLHVKHLKPTGNIYNKAAKLKQGEAFYGMRYGFWLAFIASLKLAFLKGNAIFFVDYLHGYFRAKQKNQPYLVTEAEGKFIRQHRWKGIRSKFKL
ncbi:glycosyltransferase family 2 protein [Dokdonia sinensis]|uniref:Glycosyltransferase family 2 protein n=1 Tax=Dokdonia sinensis TaxID=2479847 RepID=A0A3M0GIJ8_9FLAO|nr:glycosyltransferase family 2 protein [Dokdonia sinensis]RMB57096.1 glycosyltransferase family 2 protein [Dokdonia sinensis]